MEFHAIDVVGVRVEMPSNQPIVLLKEIGGVRYLPIWVGAVEATAIAFAQQEVVPPRPLTHDLIRDLLVAIGSDIDSVHLTEIKDGIFYAAINLRGGVKVSARPSDPLRDCRGAAVDDAGTEGTNSSSDSDKSDGAPLRSWTDTKAL